MFHWRASSWIEGRLQRRGGIKEFSVASRVAAAVKAKFTTVQTPAASTLEGQGGGIARIPPGATLRRSCSLHADTFMGAQVRSSVTAGALTRWTRTRAVLPPAVVYGRPMTSHSPLSSA